MFPSRSGRRKRKCRWYLLAQNPGYFRAQKARDCRHKNGDQAAAVLCDWNVRQVQVRRVSTKFWPAELVQLSWLVDTIRQLKLTGVWRISEVPLICTDVAPVIV